MERSYKQFEAWVTRLKANSKADEFFTARIKLTFFYSLITAVILGAASFLLYKVLIMNFTELLRDEHINPFLARHIFEKAQTDLQNRLFLIDMVILSVVVVLGFFLTQKTLGPILKNSRKQKRFIADASHELRTPVSIVISGLEVALRNKNLDLESAKIVLKKSLEEMREFATLSNTLLDISKYENRAEVAHDSIQTIELLKDVVVKMQPLAGDKNIIITADLKHNRTILGNHAELERLLFNVFSNAIAYTPERGMISLYDSVENNRYVINIKDTGQGMSEDTLKKIFDPFYRGDGSRSTSGAGLGLTLAKKIVDRHQGTLEITSELEKGTLVKITFPISE